MTQTDLAVQRVRHQTKTRLLQVRRITRLTPAMLRITLGGSDLEGFLSASFDDHVKLFLPSSPGAKPVLPTIGPDGPVYPEDQPRPISRDYTPRRYDAVAQELDIDFVVHDAGPATDWATQASVGDYLGVGGPRGSFIIPVEFDWHLLIGDETAIPAIARRLAELPDGKPAIVILKTRTVAARIDFETNAAVNMHWVLEDEDSSGEADALELAVRGLTLPAGEGYIWGAGEYTDIKRIRQYLVNEQGIDKSRIRAASYWRKEAAATHVNFVD